MRYYLDTEFAEDGRTIELISIGLVCEDGRELYAINKGFDRSKCNDWVEKNVLPRLSECLCAGGAALGYLGHKPTCHYKSRTDISIAVREFIEPGDVEIWTYFGDYDWVALCQLYGSMIELPRHFPMFAMDLKQYAVQLGITESLETLIAPENAHDAQEDARWNQRIHWHLIHRDGHRGLRGTCPVCEYKFEFGGLVPSPRALWQQASGDRDRYIELMKQHGYIIPKVP